MPATATAARPDIRNSAGTLLEIAGYLGVLLGLMLFGAVRSAMVLGAVSAWFLLRRQGPVAVAVGLTRAHLTRRSVTLAVGAAGVIAVVAWFAVRPAVEAITGTPLDLSELRDAVATRSGFLVMLAISWIYAGFGEEWVFRAYPLSRSASLGRGARLAVAVAAVVVFALGHRYQGPSGILLSGIVGAMLVGTYLATGRNLWVNVIIHGTVDTIAFFLLRFGLIA